MMTERQARRRVEDREYLIWPCPQRVHCLSSDCVHSKEGALMMPGQKSSCPMSSELVEFHDSL